MRVCLFIALIIPLAFSHHGAIDASNEKHLYLFQDDDNNLQLINLLEPVLEITVNYSDITMYHYSRDNVDSAIEINAADFNGVIDSKNFNPDRINYFLTHGYSSSYKGYRIDEMKNALLEAADCNVFIVDWSSISKQFYTTSVYAIPQIGSIIADTISKLVENYNIPYSKINTQGHSLGAQIMGAVGANLNGQINLIIANDPAYVMFNHDDLENRLDPSDAQFVHVIHSNAGLLGHKRSIGHADYYPNGGGMNQPGCGPDLVGICAHRRSTDFYVESILNSNFKAVLCESYDDFKNGKCDDNSVSYMGGINVNTEAKGNYYLDTAPSSPFPLG